MRIVWLTIIAAIFFSAIPCSANGQADILSHSVREGIIDIEYPVVSGLDNPAAEKTINTVLLDHIQQFRHAVQAEPYMRTAQSRFAIQQNADGLLSLTVVQYTYTGGAHGMSVMKGFTFDLASGEQVRFDDLVPPGGRERINDEIAKQIVEKQTPLLRPFNGINENPDFYLLPGRKLVVFYQLYELAPYAWGFVRFPFDY